MEKSIKQKITEIKKYIYRIKISAELHHPMDLTVDEVDKYIKFLESDLFQIKKLRGEIGYE